MQSSIDATSEPQSGSFYNYYPPIESQPAPMMHPPSSAGPLECKVQEINRRLRQRPDYPDRWWWDHFAHEFFDESAAILLSFCLPNEGEKLYTISRAFIPQYFRALFEDAVTDVHFVLNFPREFLTQSGPVLECDNTLTVTQYHQPSFARVLVESRLTLQCTHNEAFRIRTWSQSLTRHKEYLPRDVISMQLQAGNATGALLHNITHLGLSNYVLNFLNVSAIANPTHQEMNPGEYAAPYDDYSQRWPVTHADSACMLSSASNPAGVGRPALEYCQSPSTSIAAESSYSAEHKSSKSSQPAKKPKKPKKNQKPKDKASAQKKLAGNITNSLMAGQNHLLSPKSQDVMVVGEPVPMCSLVGDGNERQITRLENSNLDTFPGHGSSCIPPALPHRSAENHHIMDSICAEARISEAIAALNDDDKDLSF